MRTNKSSRLISINNDNLKYKFVENSDSVSGYRIMNLDLLRQEIVNISTHKCICDQAQWLVSDGQEPIMIRSEINRSRLFSIVLVCKGCSKQFQIKTVDKQSNGLYDINVRDVWGSVSSGGLCCKS